jgi:6-phosphogluconate dehydrogenase
MNVGFIGLGKMGSRMVRKLYKEGHTVRVWNRSLEPIELLKNDIRELETSDSVEALISSLPKPRVVWSMLPAGEATEAMLTQIAAYVESGDIVINGANEHFTNTEKHFKTFLEKGVRFLGIGVSGGIIASTQGYPLMVGGDKSAYEYVQPILDSLAKPNGGYAYFGEGGAGHFVKMVHNAIEYGYMQAIGEGFGVLEKSQYNLDLAKVAQLYRQNTLISGFMMDRTEEALLHDPKLENLEGVIAESGEAKWTIEEAEKADVPVAVIEKSLAFRKQSQLDPKIQASFAARMVAALRMAFGGHAVKKK